MQLLPKLLSAEALETRALELGALRETHPIRVRCSLGSCELTPRWVVFGAAPIDKRAFTVGGQCDTYHLTSCRFSLVRGGRQVRFYDTPPPAGNLAGCAPANAMVLRILDKLLHPVMTAFSDEDVVVSKSNFHATKSCFRSHFWFLRGTFP